VKGICIYFLDPDLFFDSFRDVAMATDFGQNLRNDLYSTRWHFATIRISQFRFRDDKGHNFCYIMCNFGEDRSTNPKDHTGSFCTFRDETTKIDIYQISQQVMERTSPGSMGPIEAGRPIHTPLSVLVCVCI